MGGIKGEFLVERDMNCCTHMGMKGKRIEGRAFIPLGVQCLPFKVDINSSRKTFDSLPVHIHYSKKHFNLNTLWREK